MTFLENPSVENVTEMKREFLIGKPRSNGCFWFIVFHCAKHCLRSFSLFFNRFNSHVEKIANLHDIQVKTCRKQQFQKVFF